MGPWVGAHSRAPGGRATFRAAHGNMVTFGSQYSRRVAVDIHHGVGLGVVVGQLSNVVASF